MVLTRIPRGAIKVLKQEQRGRIRSKMEMIAQVGQLMDCDRIHEQRFDLMRVPVQRKRKRLKKQEELLGTKRALNMILTAEWRHWRMPFKHHIL